MGKKKAFKTVERRESGEKQKHKKGLNLKHLQIPKAKPAQPKQQKSANDHRTKEDLRPSCGPQPSFAESKHANRKYSDSAQGSHSNTHSGQKRPLPDQAQEGFGNKRARNAPPSVNGNAPKLKGAEKKLSDFRARSINDEIAQHANRRELSEAKRCYQTAVQERIANGHTFAITVNAYIRCGDNEGADKVIRDMQSYGLSPCVITYTTLINGRCKAGDMAGALSTLREMTTRRPAVLPNLRTVNTLLRGCMLVGAVSVAESLFDSMRREWRVSPDASSYEYLLTLLCQGLRLHRAGVLIDQLKERVTVRAKRKGSTPDPAAAAARSAQVYVSMARAAAVLRDKARYRASCRQAREALRGGGEGGGAGEQEEEGRQGKERGSEGGKRGWRVTGEEREAAASVFEAHRRGELERELELIDSYAEQLFGKEGGKHGKRAKKQKQRKQEESKGDATEGEEAVRERVSDCLLRVVSLDVEESPSQAGLVAVGAQPELVSASKLTPEPKKRGEKRKQHKAKEDTPKLTEKEEEKAEKTGEEDTELSEKDRVVGRLLGALEEKFGLKEVLAQEEREDAGTKGGQGGGGKSKKRKNDGATSDAEVGPGPVEGFRSRLRRQVDKRGRVRFSRVFGNDLPVRLEVCSGAGEWAAAQAGAERGQANWVTLELRHDRVHQSFSRMLFQRLPNLAVVGGDAFRILPDHIPAGSVSAIFVNHPEPPQQTGGAEASSEGFHLLTGAFMLSMHSALAEGGMLTIVTDNRWYATLLVRIVADFNAAHRPHGVRFASKPLPANARVHTRDGVDLYQGAPGPECGHAAQASSYFDRLWQKGINRHADTTNRYILCVQRSA